MIELQKIFEVSYGTKFDLNKMIKNKSDINFVGRSAKNNGVTAKVGLINDVKPLEAGLITVALGGSVLSTFLQPQPFYTGQNIAVLKPRKPMTDLQKLFYCCAIKSNAYRFSTCGREANRTLKNLALPEVNHSPEWVDAMNLSVFEGAEKSKHVKDLKLDNLSWVEFTFDELFEIKKGVRLTKANMLPGKIPFIGSTDKNNGVTNYVGQQPIHSGNVLTVNYNGSVGEAFYQELPFWASDDVNVLYPRNSKFDRFNQFIGLFIIPIIKSNKFKFNYGRKWHMDRMKVSKISLPVNGHGGLDIDFMENYIKSIKFSHNI